MTNLVFVVVLNWNSWRDTVRCRASLRCSPYPNLHVLMVDNGSTDNPPQHLAPLLQPPWGEVVQTGRNLGFTGGANPGLRLALERGADCDFLLNNDATVAPGCITTLVDAAEQESMVGFVGPKIITIAQPTRRCSPQGIVELSHATRPLRSRANRNT